MHDQEILDTQVVAANALIRSSLDVLKHGVVIFGPDLRLLFANRKFREFRDLPESLGEVGTRFQEQLKFRALRGDFGPGNADELVTQHLELAQRFKSHWVERILPNGTVLEIRGDRLPEGGFIATYTDITARKQAQEELVERNADLEHARAIYEDQGQLLSAALEDLSLSHQQLEIANRAKSEFLATMSHELRTPLNAIIGFSEIMKTEAFGPVGNVRYQEYCGDIYESGHHLLSLVNDILDLTKIESGAEELRADIVDVLDLARASIKLVGRRAGNNSAAIDLEAPDSLPCLCVDERKLKQILVNLLSNAVKFTDPDGAVILKAWCRMDSGYVFQIVDSGIGIAPEAIPKALSRFGQIDSGLSRQYEGTGLGLPLSKALVEMHGGSLDLQSDVDVGTTVTVRFPAERIVASAGAADSRNIEVRAVG